MQIKHTQELSFNDNKTIITIQFFEDGEIVLKKVKDGYYSFTTDKKPLDCLNHEIYAAIRLCEIPEKEWTIEERLAILLKRIDNLDISHIHKDGIASEQAKNDTKKLFNYLSKYNFLPKIEFYGSIANAYDGGIGIVLRNNKLEYSFSIDNDGKFWFENPNNDPLFIDFNHVDDLINYLETEFFNKK